MRCDRDLYITKRIISLWAPPFAPDDIQERPNVEETGDLLRYILLEYLRSLFILYLEIVHCTNT